MPQHASVYEGDHRVYRRFECRAAAASEAILRSVCERMPQRESIERGEITSRSLATGGRSNPCGIPASSENLSMYRHAAFLDGSRTSSSTIESPPKELTTKGNAHALKRGLYEGGGVPCEGQAGGEQQGTQQRSAPCRQALGRRRTGRGRGGRGARRCEQFLSRACERSARRRARVHLQAGSRAP
eukprot:scaffold203842_cov41-Tisochrysis_lutea.AAC.1